MRYCRKHHGKLLKGDVEAVRLSKYATWVDEPVTIQNANLPEGRTLLYRGDGLCYRLTKHYNEAHEDICAQPAKALCIRDQGW